MTTLTQVQRQLADAGFKNKWLGWSAIRELPGILGVEEVIEKIATGMYDGGYAVIVATNKRILFLDKKPVSFLLEDIPYDMVAEVEYNISPFMAHLTIHCQSKKLRLRSFRQSSLQHFAVHVQDQVNQIRAHMANWAQMLNFRPQQQGNQQITK